MRPKNSRDDLEPSRSSGQQRRVHDHRLLNTTAVARTPILGRGSETLAWGVGKWLSSTPKSNRPSAASRRFEAGLSVSPPLVDRQRLQHVPRQQTPANTAILRKLEALLPQFCQAMAECRFLQCCTVLGSILLPPAPSGLRPRSSNSPVTSLLGGTASPLSRASPGRSPIRAWLTGASAGEFTRNDSSNSLDELNTAAVLASNMEVFFHLLGVESMYRSMAHVMSPQFAQILASSYEQALKDLQLLRFSLCDAFHVRPEAEIRPLSSTSKETDSETNTATPSIEDTVKDLAASILLLISFCQARVQCIHLQSAMWHQPPHPTVAAPIFAELAAAFAMIPPTTRLDRVKEKHDTKTVSSATPVETLLLRTLDEINAWSGLCRTTFAVQHCQ